MQHSCSHYIAFRTITSQTCTYLRTWQQSMTTIIQPFQCDLQPQIPKHPITTHAQAHPKQLEATVTLRQKKKKQTDRSRNRRTDELPFIVKVSYSGFLRKTSPMQHACSHYNAFRNITSQTCTYLRTWQQSMTTIIQPFQCDLQPQIPKHPITTHAQAHPKQLEAAVTMRQKENSNGPQPQPPHTRGTFHCRLQPLYTEKRKISCSGFLPNTNPMQHACSHYNAFRNITSQTCTYLRTWNIIEHDNNHAAIPTRHATTDSKTPYNYARTSTPKAA